MPAIVGYLAAVLIGLSIALVSIALSRRSSSGVAALQRAGVGSSPGDPPATVPSSGEEGQALGSRLASVVMRRLPGRRQLSSAETDKVRSRLDRAGLAMPAEGLMALKVTAIGGGLLLGLAVVLIFGLSATVGLVTILGSGLVAYLLPDLWVLNTAQRRQQQIDRAMPETADLLALTAQAGLGLEQGISEVSNELSGPLAAELDRYLKEQQLGVSRREALQGLIDRNSSEDLRSFCQALLQADELGSPVSKTLQVQAREMRRRRRARARERAGKAPVKLLFPLIFGIFPALFIIIMGPGALAIMETFAQ